MGENGILVVEWPEKGSAAFTLNMEHVNPLQLLALAGYLEATAKSDILRVNQMKQVQVPQEPEKLLRLGE